MLDTLFDRNLRVHWEELGSPSIVDTAREKAAQLIQENQAAPLSKEVQKDLSLLLTKAKEELI